MKMLVISFFEGLHIYLCTVSHLDFVIFILLQQFDPLELFLSWDAKVELHEDTLRDYFKKYGDTDIQLPRVRRNHAEGFGFLVFQSTEKLEACFRDAVPTRRGKPGTRFQNIGLVTVRMRRKVIIGDSEAPKHGTDSKAADQLYQETSEVK